MILFTWMDVSDEGKPLNAESEGFLEPIFDVLDQALTAYYCLFHIMFLGH